MRADDDMVDVIAGKKWQRSAFFLARSCSQRDVDTERLEAAPQHIVMLLSENLRRAHERRLISGFNCKQHGRDCNDGFS